MKELLSKYGYSYSGQCHCEGVTTEKYLNGEYDIRVRPKSGTFKLKWKGRSMTQWPPLTKLEDVLKLYNKIVAVQA